MNVLNKIFLDVLLSKFTLSTWSTFESKIIISLITQLLSTYSMPGQPISKRRQKVCDSVQRQAKLEAAITAYKENALKEKKQCLSLQEMKNRTGIPKTTLWRAGQPNYQSARQFSETKKLFSTAQELMMVKYLLGSADMGRGMDPRTLRELANEILWETRGPDHKPVNHNWPGSFITRYEKVLSTHWSKPLDRNHAEASPEMIAGFYHVYGEVLKQHAIPLTNQFGADETGIQLSVGCAKQVIGHCGKRTTYNTQGGDREQITFLPVICADSTLTGHITIFPGKKIPNKCAYNNPLQSE